jgi:hypothetical protein
MIDITKKDPENIVVESNGLYKFSRQFYLQFPIRHAVRAELNWTHYRSLIRVENPKAREVYMNEASILFNSQFCTQRVQNYATKLHKFAL